MKVQGVSVLLLCVYCVSSARVQTTLGEIEGSEYVTKSGKTIFSFLGVPYAKPPVGDNRFKEPKPARSWFGIWPAKEYSAPCIQYIPGFYDETDHITGSEDCLYLNVFTPSLSNISNLPVVVYFHGGAFMFGEGSLYKPRFLQEKYDVVFVSVNYRLGPFGFLSTQDNIVPGNNGMKDQVQALKWVQEHIAVFGGDGSKVTISGNSAGGASVHLHFLSPMSRGLFDKGISSSGSPLTPWAFQDQPLLKAQMLAASLSCPTDDNDLMIKCLKQRPSKQILSQIKPLFMPWELNPFSPFGPVVENSQRTPFLSENPFTLMKQGMIYDRPWLTSVTTEEGLYPVAFFIDREESMKTLNNDWHSIAPHLLDYNYTIPADQLDIVTDKIKKFYFGNTEISAETCDKVIEMVGDRLFTAYMYLAARIHASVTTSPVYFFTFGYRGKLTLSNQMTETKTYFGVSHFDDMFYVLNLPESEQLQSDEERAMIEAMTNIWITFIETGQPKPDKTTEWEPVQQDADVTGQLNHLFITSYDDMQMRVTTDYGNYKFWSSLGLDENVPSVSSTSKDEL